MSTSRTYTVSDIARMAGVTVRALHHYDEVGLLSPQLRSRAGYRLYGEDDLRRLHQILLWKELGLSLDEIRPMLDEPTVDLEKALADQRKRLHDKVNRLMLMITGVDEALNALNEARHMKTSKVFKELGEFDPTDYEDEAKERWGETDAYKVSAERTKGYGPKQWKQIKTESDEINQRAAALMAAGVGSASDEALQVAEAHRKHIDLWFFPCSRAMHKQIAESYTADPRFEANYEKVATGLALWFSNAVKANAEIC